jgi:hypothetical protein
MQKKKLGTIEVAPQIRTGEIKQTPGKLSGPLGPAKKEFCDEQEVVRAAQPPFSQSCL